MPQPCTNCSEPIDDDSRFCEACGTPVPGAPPLPATTVLLDPEAARPEAEMACPACGATPSTGGGLDEDGYCQACGHRVDPRRHLDIDLGALAAVTDRGARKARNEDAVAIGASPNGTTVLVVSDGVSNIPRSADASQAAVDAALALLLATPDDLAGATAAAQRAVTSVPAADPSEPPSCTFLAAVWDPATRSVRCGWVGDCRTYWVPVGGAAQRLTTDHSWGTMQVAAGAMSQVEADADHRSHSITRWLGADCPDAPNDPLPDTSQHTLDGAGMLVACSDGFWNYLHDDAEITKLIALPEEVTPLQLATRLVDHAIAAGGHDNITVAVLPIAP
jgi:serine/threonine protein phosphatase PrpC